MLGVFGVAWPYSEGTVAASAPHRIPALMTAAHRVPPTPPLPASRRDPPNLTALTLALDPSTLERRQRSRLGSNASHRSPRGVARTRRAPVGLVLHSAGSVVPVAMPFIGPSHGRSHCPRAPPPVSSGIRARRRSVCATFRSRPRFACRDFDQTGCRRSVLLPPVPQSLVQRLLLDSPTSRPPISRTNQLFEFAVQKPVGEGVDTGCRVDALVSSSILRVAASSGLVRESTGTQQTFEVHQPFVSCVVPAGHGLIVEAGTFVARLAHEVIASSGNASRSFLFGCAILLTRFQIGRSSTRVSGTSTGWAGDQSPVATGLNFF
jgi:hypothetical protein